MHHPHPPSQLRHISDWSARESVRPLHSQYPQHPSRTLVHSTTCTATRARNLLNPKCFGLQLVTPPTSCSHNNPSARPQARQLATYSAASFVANGRLNRTAVTEYLGTIGAGRLHDFYALHPSITNELQRMVVESSRFGIAAVMGEECTHGYQVDCVPLTL